jgi:AcrR family transcriptional regulator
MNVGMAYSPTVPPAPQDAPAPASVRPPGRPRSPEADRAILDATLEVLAVVGFGRLTVEGVAAHAGVGKATIYRRWPSKMALVLAAVEELATAPSPQIDTGSTRGDLVALLHHVIEALTTTIAGRILPGLVAEISHSPELISVLHNFWFSRRELMLQVLLQGAACADLPAGSDCELLADLLYGPVHYRFLISAAPLDTGFVEQLVETVLQRVPPLAPPLGGGS